MKKILIVVFLLVIILAGGAYWYWQNHKKSIVKGLIQDTVSSKTDSLYYLRYDSSMIDEVNGSAYFRNIYLQSDSDQAVLLKQTDSLPNILINIYIKSVEATGLDMQAYLQDKVVHAKNIIIAEPRIQIINTGANQLKLEDTLAIYKKIVGEFNSIRADNIEIQRGTFISKNRKGEIQAILGNTNIKLTKFKVDSTRDYSNILSYFIDNIEAEVDSISLKKNKDNGNIYLTKVNYNTNQKSLVINQLEAFDKNEKTASTSLHQLRCDDLNVKAFVQQHRIEAGKISCEGGIVTLYAAKKDSSAKQIKNKSFEFPEDFFDEVEIGSLQLGNTTLIIRDRQNPGKEPVTVRNVKLSTINEINVTKGNTIRNIIDKAKWKLSAEGFSLVTADKIYTISMSGIFIDRYNQTASINKFSVTPRITESEFVRQSKKQGDYYNINISNIKLAGLDISKVINESVIEIQQAAISLNLKVYNDRMLPVNPDSKVGKYPHQLVKKIKMPLYIKHLAVQNSYISYRERARATQQVGNVFFTNVSGTIDNITNMPSYIKNNPVTTLDGSGLFLGKGQANTVWKLRLDSDKGDFSMAGHSGKMDAAAFNAISVPLGLTSVKGQVNDFKFTMTGNDYNASGNLTLLYNDLKIESFKIDEKGDTMKSKKLENMFSNALIKDNNPSNGNIRSADFSYKRELNKSFFNLVWKSIFDGVQKTVMSKGGLEIQKELNKLKTKQKPK